MTVPPAKPLPDIRDPRSAPFWAAAREHRLVMQVCAGCGQIRWPPKPLCPNCLRAGAPDDWQKISEGGMIWSFVVYHRVFHPGFSDQIPYNVVYVKLDAGPMFISNVVGTNELAIGQRVHSHFDDITDEVTLVRFRVVDQD